MVRRLTAREKRGAVRPPSRNGVLVALTMAGVLAAIAIMAVGWMRHTRKPALQEAKLITSSGWWPALSRDGRLLAYTSNAGGAAPHIWVRQTAGGEASPVTTGSDPDAMPGCSLLAMARSARVDLHRMMASWPMTSRPPAYRYIRSQLMTAGRNWALRFSRLFPRVPSTVLRRSLVTDGG
jgi:hypothetical protein